MNTMNDPYAWTTGSDPSGGDVLTLVAPVAGPASGETPSGAMTRLLELAVRNADELVAEATAEAEALTTAARVEADQMLSEARSESERMRTETDEQRQVEREHLSGMRAHLVELMEKLEATPAG